MNGQWKWIVPAVMAVVITALWASVALGSYVYLSKMGHLDRWEFPWNQLWVALPWIIRDGWHGIETIQVWSAALMGVLSTIGPSIVVIALAVRRGFPNNRQPNIWGSTGFANRNQMQDNGIRSKRRLF